MSRLRNGLTVGSLFTGIGGLDLGLERAGHQVRWQVEIDARCRSVLQRHWPHVRRYDDVREVTNHDLEEVDLLVGGFPCQDISLAGRRAGLAGARSGLWWEFHRLVAELRPGWVVVENVPGLLSSARGRDMGAVLGALADLGYGYAWRVLDARYFGLAQRRRRVFLVCRAGADGASAAAVLLEPEGSPHRPAPSSRAPQDAPATPGGSTPSSSPRRHTRAVRRPAEPDGGGGPARGLIAATLTQHGDNLYETLVPLGVQGNSRGEARLSQIVGALTVSRSTTQMNEVLTSAGVRRLLPIERERLQGLPDDWTRWGTDSEEMPLTKRESMTGNAVAVPVARWIGRRIQRVLVQVDELAEEPDLDLRSAA